jgi:excisionase family DNA binding protein
VAQAVGGHPAAMIMNRGDALWVYTLEESAEILRCERGWLEEQAQQGKIPYTELGGSRRFTSSHVAAIVAIHERLPAPVPGAAPLPPPLAWSTAEAAELLRCTASWLKEQARSSTIPYVKLSGSYHFTNSHLAEIIRIFEARAPQASPPHAPRTPAAPATALGRPVTIKARPPRDLRKRPARDDGPGVT